MQNNKSLLYFCGALLGGIIALAILANTLPIVPYGIALGDGAFTLLILLISTYLFKVTFEGVKPIKRWRK